MPKPTSSRTETTLTSTVRASTTQVSMENKGRSAVDTAPTAGLPSQFRSDPTSRLLARRSGMNEAIPDLMMQNVASTCD